MNQNERWYFARNKDTIGPLTLAEMHALMQRGEIRIDTPVFHELLGQWTPAGKVALLQDAMTAAPPIAGPPLTIKTSQPRTNVVNKNVAPPAGHMVMRTASAPDSASTPADNFQPERAEPARSDSAKAEPAAGAGTLFDVSGAISDPDDEIIENANAMSGVDTLIEKGTFLDFIPNLLRAGFPGKVATAMGKFFASIGVWAQLAGLVLILILPFTLYKFNVLGSLKFIGLLGTQFILLLTNVYVNMRLMPSLNRLNNLGEGRIVSTALPDSLSVVFLGLAIFSLVGCFFSGLSTGDVVSIIISAVIGFILFAAFAFCSVTAANPGSLNMTVDGSLSPASEAAGAIQYLSKLFLRLSLGFYGFAMTLCTIGMLGLTILSLFVRNDVYAIEGFSYVPFVLSIVMVFVSALPLFAYLSFLGVQFFLDFAIKVVQNRR